LNEAVSILVGHDEGLHAQELAMAGMELAVYELTAIPEAPPPQGRLAFRLASADVMVDFQSESALIDLNMAPKPLLTGLFTVLGVKREDADGFADRILSWRTPLTSGPSDSEAALYRSAGRNYGPRHGPFQHVNELGLVLGLPPALVDSALLYGRCTVLRRGSTYSVPPLKCCPLCLALRPSAFRPCFPSVRAHRRMSLRRSLVWPRNTSRCNPERRTE
jgi:hypothetical protein